MKPTLADIAYSALCTLSDFWHRGGDMRFDTGLVASYEGVLYAVKLELWSDACLEICERQDATEARKQGKKLAATWKRQHWPATGYFDLGADEAYGASWAADEVNEHERAHVDPEDVVEIITLRQAPVPLKKKGSRMNGRTYWGRRGAGALIYCPKTGHLLLGLRSGDVMEPYTWGGFGGKIDDDDVDPLDAALREVNEETAFDPSNLVSAEHLWTYETPTFSYFNYLMLAKVEFEPQLNWENDDYGWFPLGELPEPQHYGLVAVLPYLRKAIEKLGPVSKRAKKR